MILFLYDSSLSEFFSLVRKERKGQKEEGIDSRLGDADTHASHMCQSPYHAGRRSRRPLQDKTQSIANSQNKKYILHSVSTLASPTPAHLIMRACRQCVHESARLPRALCSHAWYSLDCGERKTADFRFVLCRTHSPRTTSCD